MGKCNSDQDAHNIIANNFHIYFLHGIYANHVSEKHQIIIGDSKTCSCFTEAKQQTPCSHKIVKQSTPGSRRINVISRNNFLSRER